MRTQEDDDDGPNDNLRRNSPPSPLITPRVIRLFVVTAGATVSFYTPLSALPSLVQDQTGSSTAAGATTAVLMLTTVVTELFSVPLMRRWPAERLLFVGVALLGLPALALTVLPPSLNLVLAVSALRGIGFALSVVVGGALAARSFPGGRKGEGMGVYGVVVGVFSITALPIGLMIGQNWGYAAVSAITAGSAIAVLPAASRLHRTRPQTDVAPSRGDGRWTVSLVPAIGFLGTTIAAGVIITFLPITFSALGHASTVAIACQSVASTSARWLAGRLGDRRSHRELLAPGIGVAAIGVAALVVADTGLGVTAAMIVFGIGFGVTMNASLAVMLESVPPSHYGGVSAQWNLAYDIGLGIGSIGFGMMLNLLPHRASYALVAGVVAVPLMLVTPRARRR